MTLLAAGALSLSAVAISAGLVHGAESGATPPPIRPALPRRAAARPELELAGSGTNMPLTRLLLSAFERAQPGPALVLHGGIGSTGGLRALRAGAVDAALISRAPKPEEAPGLRIVPYARAAVVLAANPSVPRESLSSEALLALYSGTRTRWRDGSPVVLLQREPGDSAHLALAGFMPEFASVDQAARSARRFPVLYTDDAMQAALLRTRGGAGLFDLGAIVSQGLPLTVLPLDGIEPSLETLRAARYPVTRELAFAFAGEPAPRLRAFLDFVASDAGRAICEQNGYLPLPEAKP